MPTISHSIIPKPKSWDEFEDIALSSFRIRWNSPNLQRHGRIGQHQNGVDIYGSDDLGRLVGIQCKLQQEITGDEIDEEIGKAEKFVPRLNAFYFAVSLSRDSNIQTMIRLKSENRIRNKKFPIGIFFWEDISGELCKNEMEFRRHYPQFKLSANEMHEGGPRRIAVIDLAFYSSSLRYYMSLLFGELGQMANEDPLQLQKICGIIEKSALILFNQKDSSIISIKTTELLNYILPWVMEGTKRPLGWTPANNLATEIENLSGQIEYSLHGRELPLYSLGSLLGRWNVIIDESSKRYPKEFQSKITRLAWNCFHNFPLQRGIKSILQEYHAKDEIYTLDTPFRIYQAIRRLIMQSGG